MVNRKHIIETLCRLTETGDEVDRCYASRALGVLGDTSAIAALIERLRDEDVDVSIDAAEALGKIGDSSAIPALLESLTHDPDGEVKTAVVEALGKIGGHDVIAPLLEMAKSCPDDMAWDDTGGWNAWWDMQLFAVKALGRMGVVEAVPVLAALLVDEEGQDIESDILTALALIGGEGEHVLIQRLTKGLPRERRRAAIALGLSKSMAARQALAYAMTDREAEVRVAALRALGKQGGVSQYLDIILRFLKDPDPEMRHAVIEVTTDLSDLSAFLASEDNANIIREKFAPLLTDSSPQVRAAALKALQGVGLMPPEMVEQIRQCLTVQDNTVVAAACTLLAHQGDQSVLVVLLQILSNQQRDAWLRSQVATALGILGNFEAVGILSWAVRDEAQPVRLAALNALMQLERQSQVSKPNSPAGAPSPKAQTNEQAQRTPLEIIIAALKGKVEPANASTVPVESANASQVATDSANASRVATESANASPVTNESANAATASNEIQIYPDDAQPSPSTESLAAEGLQNTTDDDIPKPRPAMSTLEAIAMDNMEAALLMNEPAEAASHRAEEKSSEIQEYIDIAQDNIELGERLFVPKKVEVATDVRHLSARILGKCDREEAVKALIEALNDDDPILRREAADSLGQIARRSPETKGLADAFENLITFINTGDREMRLACARTLGTLNNPAAIPARFASLPDEEASVRTQAIQSLTALISEITPRATTEAILAQLVELLHKTEVGVRKAAAEALAALRHTEALDSIIDAAFEGSGATARDMGKALRILEVEQSATKLLKKLESVPDSLHRRFVIEMLEEVCSRRFSA